jgi:hypothetical protein
MAVLQHRPAAERRPETAARPWRSGKTTRTLLYLASLHEEMKNTDAAANVLRRE